MKSVILFSGGLDSSTLISLALSQNESVYPLTVFYNQRHAIEVKKAHTFLQSVGLSETAKEIRLDLSFLQKSSLINKNVAIPDNLSDNIPNTYVPSRNLIFLSYAASYAESLNAEKIYIGVNAVDYSGYPDCRPAFIDAFNTVIQTGTKQGVEQKLIIETPLIHLSKKDIVLLGYKLGLDFSLTHSCYNPDENGRACGICDSCRLRLKGFKEAGLTDTAVYQNDEMKK